SWTALGTSGFLTTGSLRNIGVAKANGNVIGAVASGGRVFLTNNGGTSWTATASPTNNGLSMSSVSFDPTNTNIVYASSVAPDATKAHLWKSADFGASWTILDGNPGFPAGVPVNSIVPDPNLGTTLYAGTHLGVYRSTDGGANWARFGAGMPLVNVTDFYISPSSNRMRAATFGRSFWELLP
ncbi:MAG: hypothetical protein M3505_10185, partial [Verrucomicrobiota bacterium]|nr:hypothetical protein [Verrucomicrobiota bacterium]